MKQEVLVAELPLWDFRKILLFSLTHSPVYHRVVGARSATCTSGGLRRSAGTRLRGIQKVFEDTTLFSFPLVQHGTSERFEIVVAKTAH